MTTAAGVRVVHNVWRTDAGAISCLVRSHVSYDTNEAVPPTIKVVRDICGGADPVPIADELGAPDMWRMGLTTAIVDKETGEVVRVIAVPNPDQEDQEEVRCMVTHCEVIWVSARLAVALHPGLEGKVTAQVYGLGDKHNPEIAGSYVFSAPVEDDDGNKTYDRRLDAEVHYDDGCVVPREHAVSTRMTPEKEAFARMLAPIVSHCLDPARILSAWEQHDHVPDVDAQRHGEGLDLAIALNESM